MTGVVGRAEVLSAMFFILSFISYEKSKLHNGCKCRGTNILHELKEQYQCSIFSTSSAVKGHLLLVLSLLFSIVSLLSKEQGVTVVAVCVAYDFLQNFQVNHSCFQLIMTRYYTELLHSPLGAQYITCSYKCLVVVFACYTCRRVGNLW